MDEYPDYLNLDYKDLNEKQKEEIEGDFFPHNMWREHEEQIDGKTICRLVWDCGSPEMRRAWLEDARSKQKVLSASPSDDLQKQFEEAFGDFVKIAQLERENKELRMKIEEPYSLEQQEYAQWLHNRVKDRDIVAYLLRDKYQSKELKSYAVGLLSGIVRKHDYRTKSEGAIRKKAVRAIERGKIKLEGL